MMYLLGAIPDSKNRDVWRKKFDTSAEGLKEGLPHCRKLVIDEMQGEMNGRTITEARAIAYHEVSIPTSSTKFDYWEVFCEGKAIDPSLDLPSVNIDPKIAEIEKYLRNDWTYSYTPAMGRGAPHIYINKTFRFLNDESVDRIVRMLQAKAGSIPAELTLEDIKHRLNRAGAQILIDLGRNRREAKALGVIEGTR